ncbi:AbrB/MazE/SpoVT family DNA-binding domain-containing protein [Bacillus sp. IITD106]|nr:AbrB/MazE/SpoVT family DNA-binding domain-containing protein [Bacillus sp. IITD106]
MLKGQITIPKDERDRFNVNEGDQFKIFVQDDKIMLEPIKKKKLSDVLKNRIKVSEPIDIEKMREEAGQELANQYKHEELLSKNE